MKRTIFLLMIVMAGALRSEVKAQDVAIKTNLLSDAFMNVNLGIEVGLAPRWSIDLSGDFNAWDLSRGRKWKHWFVQPEARYWLCEALGGHFFGLHAMAGQYNIGHLDMDFKFLGTDFGKFKDNRYQGWFGGLGVAYGYAWLLGKHWSLEGEIGVGWLHTKYDKFECEGCGRRVGNGRHDYFGPTKAAINLVYVF